MTPEEKFNQDIWWILQEIRTDELLTPKGENIEFNIRTQSKTISKVKNYFTAIPSDDVQTKLLYKLKDWKAIDVELVDNILKGSDVFHPRIHKLTIKRPKFDELYKEYERIYNTDEQFFNNEKEKIQNIKVGTQHKIARDKWLNVKRILDAIYKLISPFNTEKKVDYQSTLSNILSKRDIKIHNRNLGQKIFLDPNKLPKEQQQFFESTLRHLLDIEAVNYVNYEDENMISSSEPIRNFLKGNILIRDRNKFEQYHNQIAEFVDFIQQDGKERFPELYDKHPKVVEQIQPVNIEPNYPRPMIEITGEADRGMRWLNEKHHQTQLQRKQFKQDRILQTKKDKYVHAIDEIIERLESYDDGRKNISIDYHYFNFEDRMDDSKIFERFLDKLVRAGCLEKFGRSNYAGGTSFSFIGVDLGKLKKYREKIIKEKGVNDIGNELKGNGNIEHISTTTEFVDKYIISVKDREIWVNQYLISKPHAVGSNFEFFEHIRLHPSHTKIERDKLPSKFGRSSIKEQVKTKSFIKIVNELGFKGEILKAFFYDRGKDTITYRGDEITKENLQKAGVKIPLFLKELELAHTKNSPE